MNEVCIHPAVLRLLADVGVSPVGLVVPSGRRYLDGLVARALDDLALRVDDHERRLGVLRTLFGRVRHELRRHAPRQRHVLAAVALQVLRSGGTFYCAVNYFEENEHTHEWQEKISIDMTLWDYERYREAFREAGFHVAEQDTIPDRETEIPPAEEFPTEEWETREAMVERYREFGTLLTVGVAP